MINKKKKKKNSCTKLILLICDEPGFTGLTKIGCYLLVKYFCKIKLVSTLYSLLVCIIIKINGVLVNLVQFVRTMYNICKIRSSNSNKKNQNKWARVDSKKGSHLSQIKALKVVNSPPLIVLVHP